MKIYWICLIAFSMFLPPAAFASGNADQEEIACAELYHHHYEAYHTLLKELENKPDEKQKEIMAEIMHHSMVIAARADECGPSDDRFYKEQATLCLGYMRSGNIKRFFDLLEKPFPYCDTSLERGNEEVFVGHVIFYLRGEHAPKNYKKAIDHIENFAKSHREDIVYLATPIYRRGGYGVKKDDRKAFEILSGLAAKYQDTHYPCELSLYYRDGIGTPENANEAEKWLAIYKTYNRKQECDFGNFGYFFEKTPLEEALMAMDWKE